MMFRKGMRVITMKKRERKRMRTMIMMLSEETLPKMRTMRRRRRMRRMPNLLTMTLFLPNIGLGANRINRMNNSPP